MQVDTVRLLGIDIDCTLTFKEHVDKICKKISQRIGILNKIKQMFAAQTANSVL